MASSKAQHTRRATVALLGAVAAVSACGFTPVYAPSGGGGLVGRVSLPTPRDRNTQLFHNRILDRLGHPGGGAHRLNVTLSTTQQGLGTTSDGQTTLYQVSGVARFTLTQDGSGTLLSQGRTEGFTSYSATESTVATLAAETDATARLMTLLADQALDRMTLDMAARGGA